VLRIVRENSVIGKRSKVIFTCDENANCGYFRLVSIETGVSVVVEGNDFNLRGSCVMKGCNRELSAEYEYAVKTCVAKDKLSIA
jgi:hypothetical protein